LTPATTPFFTFPPGDGPRHFHFHPNGKWLYSIQEEGSTVSLLDYDPQAGSLKHRQTRSTLPEGYAGSNFCSEILVSHDGRYVYVGNRLHDSIGIFSVQADGTLKWVKEEWTRGDYPRSFTLDPSGRWLYCCNQRADHVTVFQVDPSTGDLVFTGQYIPVGNPSMVLIVPLPSA
jgi:6-phosphogluconolactonase (cycloisomerase 2 family)